MGRCVCAFREERGKGSGDDMQRAECGRRAAVGGRGGDGVQGW